jgi:hypothetical protein
MESRDRKFILMFLLAGLCLVAIGAAWRAQHAIPKLCFTASKIYDITPQAGAATRDGWAVNGDAFDQCVHRAETADIALHKRYPDGKYALSLASTIGCHYPCDG